MPPRPWAGRNARGVPAMRVHDKKQDMKPELRPLDSWDVFVLRHRKTPNLIFHVISFTLFWLSLPLAAVMHQPVWAAGFFTSGLFGTAGHYLFGDGTVDKREATSSAQVVYFSSAMVLLFVTGFYG